MDKTLVYSYYYAKVTHVNVFEQQKRRVWFEPEQYFYILPSLAFCVFFFNIKKGNIFHAKKISGLKLRTYI